MLDNVRNNKRRKNYTKKLKNDRKYEVKKGSKRETNN